MKPLAILLSSLALHASALAANHYILDGGSGDGTSWSSAWDDLPATLSRGDTYYIGDGDYAAYTFNDATSGTTLITVKKATAADHGTETGWSSTYGDGRATWTAPIEFDSSYWVFDGVTGGGPGSWASTNSYGFGVYYTGSDDLVKLIQVNNTSANITVRHTDTCYVGDIGGTLATGHDSFYCLGGSDITLSYCAFRHAGRVHIFLQQVDNLTVEYCYLYRNKECTTQHSTSLSDNGSNNLILRYSLFREIMGTGIVEVQRSLVVPSDNWEIYGNVFLGEGGREYTCSDSPIVVIQTREANGWKIYNNSFINLTPAYAGGSVGIDFSQGTTSTGGHQIYNNLWYDGLSQNESATISFASGDSTSVHDYSYWNGMGSFSAEDNDVTETGNPFLDLPSLDFRLAAATAAGYSLSAPYNVDALGNTRGADGVWDRGAYEYAGTPETRTVRATTVRAGIIRRP